MIETFNGVPLLGVTAASGSGKTTLLSTTLPLLRQAGLRIAAVKHTHHPFEIDQPGKDSYVLRKAGATQMLLGSADRWALMVEHEQSSPEEPGLIDLLGHLDTTMLDLIIVEGFKMEHIPKIEVYREELGNELIAPKNDDVIAVATNAAQLVGVTARILDIDDPQAVATFVIEHIEKHSGFPNRRHPA
ncbi:MAG: molybdopterin-guanine dinucleotide biosynthesis protein B [Gammaproteobacteria bacterium]